MGAPICCLTNQRFFETVLQKQETFDVFFGENSFVRCGRSKKRHHCGGADTAPPSGTAYFLFTNLDDGGLHPSENPNFTNPNATTDGALWIKTGTAAPVWLSQDVNLRLDWRPTPTSPWTTITTLLLEPPTPPPTYANGSGWGDVTALGYPGNWLDNSGQGNPSLPMPQSNYSLESSGAPHPFGEYWLPGTDTIDRSDWSQFQFELYAWTGTATSFASAVAGGEYVADSGAFSPTPATRGASAGTRLMQSIISRRWLARILQYASHGLAGSRALHHRAPARRCHRAAGLRSAKASHRVAHPAKLQPDQNGAIPSGWLVYSPHPTPHPPPQRRT